MDWGVFWKTMTDVISSLTASYMRLYPDGNPYNLPQHQPYRRDVEDTVKMHYYLRILLSAGVLGYVENDGEEYFFIKERYKKAVNRVLVRKTDILRNIGPVFRVDPALLHQQQLHPPPDQGTGDLTTEATR